MLWATANQLLVTKHGGITGHILSCLCEYLGIPCGCHPAQLHIEEFVALEADEVSRNFNLQSLAKSKPLKNAPAEHANVREEDDGDQLDVPRETRAQGDVVVGELESDFEDMDDLYQAAVPESPHVQFSLVQCKIILSRSEEIERCSRKGRHRESDMQMKQFAAVFGDSLQTPQSQVPSRHYSLGLHSDVGRLSLYQNALAKLLRREIDRHDTSHETVAANLPADVAVADLSALLDRNDNRERLAATVVPLPHAWRGPAHIAKLLMTPFPFNDEQLDILATLVWPLEEAWRARPDPDSISLPIDKPLVRALLCGGGGCGKTTMILKVLKPLMETFFPEGGGCVLAAPKQQGSKTDWRKDLAQSWWLFCLGLSENICHQVFVARAAQES